MTTQEKEEEVPWVECQRCNGKGRVWIKASEEVILRNRAYYREKKERKMEEGKNRIEREKEAVKPVAKFVGTLSAEQVSRLAEILYCDPRKLIEELYNLSLILKDCVKEKR